MPTTPIQTTATNGASTAAAVAERTAEQVQDLTRRGLDRALEVSEKLREQALRAGDRTKSYIQDEPVKAVLAAAAVGAAVALLVRALSGSRRD